MKVLVTGATGFIGRRLLPLLAQKNVTVVPLQGDIQALSQAAVQQIDGIIHLAGVTPGGVVEPEQRQKLFATNVLGSLAVATHAKRCGAWVLFTSTCAVYQSPAMPQPLHEQATAIPRNDYGMSKWLAERLLQQAAVPVTALRLFNVYGTGQRANSAIGSIMQQLQETTPLTIERPTSTRDFIHVDDVVRLMAELLPSMAQSAWRCFNVGTGQATTFRQLVQQLQKLMDKPTATVLERQPELSADHFVADMQALQQAVAWRPQITLMQGLQELLTH